jgi:hypothetical protein
MPGVLIDAEKLGASMHTWSDAFEKGVDAGLEKAMAEIRTVAQRALASLKDPWGEVFAPRSPMTVRLRAIEIEDVGRLGDALMSVRRSPRKWTLVPRGKHYIAGHMYQFGMESKHVFDNAETVTQPPRPFLPIRGEETDLPPELDATVERVIKQAITEAFVKEGIQDSQRAQRAIRRR